MTEHKALHTGLVSPSPLDRWINALLHAFAMLMSFAACLCSMRLIRLPAACHSDATPEALPCRKSGKFRETLQAAASSHIADTSSTCESREGLMVSSFGWKPKRPSNPSRSDARVAPGEPHRPGVTLSTSSPNPRGLTRTRQTPKVYGIARRRQTGSRA